MFSLLMCLIDHTLKKVFGNMQIFQLSKTVFNHYKKISHVSKGHVKRELCVLRKRSTFVKEECGI